MGSRITWRGQGSTMLSDAALCVLGAVERVGEAGLTSHEIIAIQSERGDDRTRLAMQKMAHNLAVQGYLQRLPKRAGEQVSRWVRTLKAIPEVVPKGAPKGTPRNDGEAAPALDRVSLVGGHVHVPASVARSVFEWRGVIAVEAKP